MTPEERYPQVDRDEAARRGITVEELFREEGLRQDIDGLWYAPMTNGKGAGQIRWISKETPEGDDFELITADPRAIEMGDRALGALVLENGDTEEQRRQAEQWIGFDARDARLRGDGKEIDRQVAEIERTIRESDERLGKLLDPERERQDWGAALWDGTPEVVMQSKPDPYDPLYFPSYSRWERGIEGAE